MLEPEYLAVWTVTDGERDVVCLNPSRRQSVDYSLDEHGCLSARVCVSVCERERKVDRLSGSLAVQPFSLSGLSEKEFEVEDLRSPPRPHPCSQISC